MATINYLFVPYLWVTMLLTAIILFLGIYVFRHKNVLGGRYFLLTLFFAFVWIIAQGMEMSAQPLQLKLIWANIQYIPILCISCSYLLLILKFTGNPILNKKWFYPALFTVPVIINILLWIDGIKHLFRQNVMLDTSGIFPTVAKDFGPLFYVIAVYNHVIILFVCIVLLYAMRDKISIYKSQLQLFFVAVLIPVLANIIYITKVIPLKVDPTPIVFSLSSIAIFINIFRFKLFNVMPIARSMILDNMKVGIVVLDLQGRFLDINPAAKRMLKLKGKNIIGKLFSEKMSQYPECVHAFNDQQETVIELDSEYVNKDSCHEISFSQIYGADQQPIGWLIQIYDITSRKISERIVQHAASHDPLTGLPNRGYFKTLCSTMIENAKKDNKFLALAYIDIDNYKNINDTYGHDVGDNVLDIIAKRLINALPENSIICRIGGDEFVAMFYIENAVEYLNKVGNDILESIKEKIPKIDANIIITASIGFCLFPEHGKEIDELLKKADKAMYKVKEKDKNGYCIYNS